MNAATRTAIVLAAAVIAAILAAGALLGAVITSVVAPQETPDRIGGQRAAAPSDSRETPIAQGARVFHRRCARCHGANAQGKIGPSLIDTRLSEGGIQAVVRQGIPPLMPSFGSILAPEEIQAVAAYVQSLGSSTATSSQQTSAQNAIQFIYPRWPMCP